jgi:hypothetical protein
LLYTLNRANADVAPLIAHDITATGAAGLADVEPPGTAGLTGTAGLVDPDGILGLVPGTGTDPVTNPARVLWLRKDKNAYAKQTVLPNATNSCIDTQSQAYTSKKANGDKTVLHVATTTDGITFTDLGPVNGLNNPDDTASVGGFRFIGPNGTILTYDDGSFGLFFSGGNCQDGDSDAYHFIGYAHSTDLVNWSVDNGATNPLVAVDYTYPQTAPQKYYTGRVYDPQVIVNGDGTGTLIFSGYQTGKPLADVGVGVDRRRRLPHDPRAAAVVPVVAARDRARGRLPGPARGVRRPGRRRRRGGRAPARRLSRARPANDQRATSERGAAPRRRRPSAPQR